MDFHNGPPDAADLGEELAARGKRKTVGSVWRT